jgi:hypothetical protein
VLFHCHRSLPRSLSLPLSSQESVCFSSVTGPCLAQFPSTSRLQEVHACPLSPVLALLTFPPLLVSSLCVLFLCCQSLLHSLSLPFLSLESACFFSVAGPCPAYFPSPSHLQRVCAFPLLLVLASLTFPPILISSLCVLFLCCRSLPRSFSLPRSSQASACFSSVTDLCLAHFPILVSRECVLFLCRQFLPPSLCLPFLSLGSACFSSVTGPCFTHFPSPSRL